MNSRYATPVSIVAIAAISLACNCRWFKTQAQIQALFDESDYVFVGRPIKTINPYEKSSNKRNLGRDIMVKVISAKKGVYKSDAVIILQGESNCAKYFIQKDSVIVFGHKIENINRVSSQSEKQYTAFDYETKTIYINRENKMFKQYKVLQAKYDAVETTQCISFSLRYRPVAEFMQSLKK